MIAGTVAGKRDMFACGPLSGMGDADTVEGPSFAWAGTGGLEASAAMELASRSHSGLAGEDLLTTIVDVALRKDPNSGYPTYRSNLEDGASEPEIWLLDPT